MDSSITYSLVFTVLILIELLYFRVASHYNVIDQPNLRSSHSEVTLRGGGIIFPISVILYFFLLGYQFPFFVLGLLLISVVSFLDDLLTLSNKVRLLIHLLAVALMFYEFNLFQYHWMIIVASLIFVIGTINAYNFMDGINGITGTYSLGLIITFFWLNTELNFIDDELLIYTGLSLFVFNFFNFRKKAKCFAGDVGSVSIAFIVVFLLGTLIIQTLNFTFITLLLVYGLDVVTTVIFRSVRKENIFEAHRTHFYQFLANEKGWSHLSVSFLYVGSQLLVNCIIIGFFKLDFYSTAFFCVSVSLVFVLLRFKFEGRNRLLGAIKVP